MITINFPGIKPKAKERPRHDGRNGRMHMPQPYLDWKGAFAYIARKDWAKWLTLNGYPIPSVIDGPVAVTVTYTTPSGNMRPDLDNALGAVLDGLQDAGVIGNDSQVRELSGRIETGPYAIRVGITELPMPVKGAQRRRKQAPATA